MSTGPRYRFDEFVLDVSDRQLFRGDTPIDLSARYFDALVLLVRRQGQLVEKDEFFAEVWADVVVSDEALTQCIKTVRKRLGDDASDPRYIRTVPGYGYRFIAPVELLEPVAPAGSSTPSGGASPGASEADGSRASRRAALLRGVAGTVGGGVAGILGGCLYGLGLAYGPAATGPGAASVLLVLLSLNILVGLLGGLGVGFGIAAADLLARGRWPWRIAGAALGGLVVGGVVKLLGVDAFNLLFGHAPAGITGGLEGAALGAALAMGAHLAGGLEADSPSRPIAGAGLAGAVAGMAVPLAGGRLMGGSLELLARSFAGSRLQLDALGRLFGELQFGYRSQLVLGGLEGLLFGSCVVGAIVLARAYAPGSTPDGAATR